MAAFTLTRIPGKLGLQFLWSLTTADPTGDPITPASHPEIGLYSDWCWQAYETSNGTWGGATAAVQGANVDTEAVYGAVNGAAGGSAITWTANGGPKTQLERPLCSRPKLTTAGTDAQVTVILVCKRNMGAI